MSGVRKVFFLSIIIAILPLLILQSSSIKIDLENLVQLHFHSDTLFVNLLNIGKALSILLILYSPIFMAHLGENRFFICLMIINALLLLILGFTIHSAIIYLTSTILFVLDKLIGTVLGIITQQNISNKHRSTIQSILTVLGGAVGVASPVIAKKFGEDISLYLIYAVGALLLLVGFYFSKNKQDIRPQQPPGKKGIKQVLKDSIVIFEQPQALLLIALGTFNGLMYSFLVFIGDEAHFNAKQIVEFQEYISLGTVIFALPLGILADRLGVFLMFIFYICGIISCHVLILILPQDFAFIATLYFALGAFGGAAYTLSISYLGNIFSPQNLPKVYASRSVISSLIVIGFNYVYGAVLNHFHIEGINILLLILNGLGVAGLIIFHVCQKRAGSANSASETKSPPHCSSCPPK